MIEASTNLAGWAPVFTNTTPTNVLFYTDPDAGNFRRGSTGRSNSRKPVQIAVPNHNPTKRPTSCKHPPEPFDDRSLTICLLLPAFTRAETAVLAWVQRYNGPANRDESAVAVAVDNNNNVIVAGSSTGSEGFSDYATVEYSGAGLPLLDQPLSTGQSHRDRPSLCGSGGRAAAT